MTHDMTIGDGRDRLLVEAAEWLIQLSSGEATQEDADELARWRAQSTDHDDAFRKVAGVHTLTRAMANDKGPTLDRRAVLAGGSVLAAVIGTFGIVRPPLSLWPSLAELMADHRTAAGQRYAFEPVAGVEVEMNSRTSLSLADAGRGIMLISGEAFVSAHLPSGLFSVETAASKVTTRSAAFNVRTLSGLVTIACTKGTVDCQFSGARERISAGEQLVLGAGDDLSRTRIDPGKMAAWRHGLLIFEGTPLAEVVEQINLYRPGRIMLTDSALGRRPVNGVFHTDRIENTVEQIQQALGLQVRNLPGGVLLMG